MPGFLMNHLLNSGILRMASLVNSFEYLRNKLYQSCTNSSRNPEKNNNPPIFIRLT